MLREQRMLGSPPAVTHLAMPARTPCWICWSGSGEAGEYRRRHAHGAALSFLACLSGLEQWLGAAQIPYAVFGSVAAAAWIDQGTSLDFDRPGAREPAERIPDIDLLVPRASLDRVKGYARAARRGAASSRSASTRSGPNAGSTSGPARRCPS